MGVVSVNKTGMAVAAVGALVLTACAPEEGEVVDKVYTEESTYTECEWETERRADGSTYQECDWEERTRPERFSLVLENGEDRGPRAVPESVYNDCSVGEWYEAGECS